ncbi:hypothetical protein E5288_WYG019354 [Bos mutus]|uniref:Kazal-like domain-containing protein n=1 Tax=Bos mutus TaxID=72004 RepID=A0A6B0RAR1_9CETA|nr:hypothetical protein [Bos mutus]
MKKQPENNRNIHVSASQGSVYTEKKTEENLISVIGVVKFTSCALTQACPKLAGPESDFESIVLFDEDLNYKDEKTMVSLKQEAFLRYKVKMDKTNCMSFMLSPHTCTGEHEPVCATNGHTYRNICILCSEKMDRIHLLAHILPVIHRKYDNTPTSSFGFFDFPDHWNYLPTLNNMCQELKPFQPYASAPGSSCSLKGVPCHQFASGFPVNQKSQFTHHFPTPGPPPDPPPVTNLLQRPKASSSAPSSQKPPLETGNPLIGKSVFSSDPGPAHGCAP